MFTISCTLIVFLTLDNIIIFDIRKVGKFKHSPFQLVKKGNEKVWNGKQ
jgi:hypothetical protein